MDPVSQTQACDVLSSLGFGVVGWYHSHPSFHPNPSLRDINTQDQFQVKLTEWGNFHLIYLWICGLTLCVIYLIFQSYFSRGGAPFIGMIVSPYDPANSSPHSQTTCLLVKENQEPSGPQSKSNTHPQKHDSNFRPVKIKGLWNQADYIGQWFCIHSNTVYPLAQSLCLCSSPRAAVQIRLPVITRHPRLGTDDEEGSVDHPQILPSTSVSETQNCIARVGTGDLLLLTFYWSFLAESQSSLCFLLWLVRSVQMDRLFRRDSHLTCLEKVSLPVIPLGLQISVITWTDFTI